MIYSIEAEQAVIASVLLQVSQFEDIDLTADHFAEPANSQIWAVMAELSADSKSCDFITVSDKLPDLMQYIVELVEGGHSSTRADEYAPIIIDKWKRRRTLQIASALFNEIGTGDIDEVVSGFGDIGEAVQTTSSDLAPDTKKALKEALQEIDDLARSGGAELLGCSTGIAELDDKTNGLQDSDLVILAARPSMGKTALSLNLARAALEKGPVFYFSLEMKRSKLLKRMISAESGLDYGKVLNGTLEADEWDKLTRSTMSLMDYHMIIDDRSGITPADMASASRVYQKKYGKPAMIAVDYLQIMDAGKKMASETEKVQEISKQLKRIAKRFDCPVLALSQLNRSLEARPNKRPVNSDLRQSGAIEQDADVIMFIYRDEVYNPNGDAQGIAEIIIGKQRDGEIGTVFTSFVGKHQKFMSLYRSQS